MKKIFLILLILFIVIQFLPTEKNISATESTGNITKLYNIPPDVLTILKTSCYDCHSNNTQYPWYNKVQPIAWLLQSHVKEGKMKLNFDEFAAYREEKRMHKIEEVREMIEKDAMPLKSYTFIHRNAALTEVQKQMLINWTKFITPETAR